MSSRGSAYDQDGGKGHQRDRSCLLRCSLRLKALLQNWHLYFFSAAIEAFGGGDESAGLGEGTLGAGGIESPGESESESEIGREEERRVDGGVGGM